MRFYVSVPLDASCTIQRTYEIEANSVDEAKQLIDSDEAWELDDDKFFPVGDDTILEVHNSEMQPDALERMTAKQVG